MAHIPRVYLPGSLAPGPVTIGGEAARHLSTVMRVREGDPLLLFSGDGREWHAAVVSTTKGGVVVSVGELARIEPQPPVRIQVCAGVVRTQRFELLIEKCTEAGVDTIRPMTTEFSGRGDAPSAARTARWERIAVEATEQSGRVRVPVIAEARPFTTIAGGRGPLVIADAAGRPASEIAPLLPTAGELTVLVGPEGGFSPAEVAAAKASGALPMRLGPHIMRTETAAIAAVVLLRQVLPA